MSHYYECDNILNNSCNKYSKKHKKEKIIKNNHSYGYYCNEPYHYNNTHMQSYNPQYNVPNNMYFCNSILLLIILLMLNNGCNDDCSN